ncbi:hypothetical protein [Cucumibacter marinus]|uniref:hypothetical protein n=1 Tax=Cucumibacter marinus TaxID=1121252 RepID=UPI000427C7C3|nr:hypothetical protein [Cucumibacter marinus]
MRALKLAVITAMGLGVAACQPGEPCYEKEEICALLAAKVIIGGILISSAGDEDDGPSEVIVIESPEN